MIPFWAHVVFNNVMAELNINEKIANNIFLDILGSYFLIVGFFLKKKKHPKEFVQIIFPLSMFNLLCSGIHTCGFVSQNNL